MNNFESIQSLNELTKMYKSYLNSNDIIRSYQNLQKALITKASIHMNMSKEEMKKIFEHEDSNLFDQLTEEKVLIFSQQYIKKTKATKREIEKESNDETLNDDEIKSITQIEKKAKVHIYLNLNIN
jgi:hypothetical protein